VTDGPAKPILARSRKTMIRLSHSRRATALALVWVVAAVAGCCGGAPSHKCMFAPLAPPDAAADASFPCGTQVCQSPTVCCFTKILPNSACVPPEEYKARGCEQMERRCGKPSDCDLGMVCCVGGSGDETCRPAPLCPGDGNPTFRACDTDVDCPPNRPSCVRVSGTDQGSVVVSLCY
jgi:hypothetical protein